MSSVRAAKVCTSLSPQEWAYLAGILDGEGTVAIYGSGKPGQIASLSVKVSNTEEELLRWIERRVGGMVYSARARKAEHRPVFLWQCGGMLAVDVLKNVLPFLIIKKDRALLALEFMVRRFEDEKTSEIYRERMKQLNRRGL